MNKKLFAIIGALVVLLAAGAAFRLTRGPKASPPGQATFNQGGLEITVDYHRPSKKGRVIFGEKADGALVPYGQWWRLGANNATEIALNKNVTVGGKPVNAGRYRMYAMPGAGMWKVVLNSQLGKWGAFEADHDKDVATVEVPVERSAAPVEQFTIQIIPDGNGARLEFAWDLTVVHVPVTPAN